MHLNFTCPKCSSNQYEIDEFRAVGGIWTKFFNIQTKRFSTVSCARCHYTEIYKAEQSALSNIFDFFGN